MGLRPTHQGYAYQDLLTAIRLVDVALGLTARVTVDTKLYDTDRFDDLTTEWLTGKRERVQIKHSEQDKDLAKATFTADKRGLRLDLLIHAINVDAVDHPDTDYRVLLRDEQPQDIQLTAVLRPVDPNDDPGPALHRVSGARLRFDFEALSTTEPWATKLQDLDDAAVRRMCDTLIVEVGTPAFSLDVRHPGPAEQVLLRRVAEELGAGRPPNQRRTPEDVALALITAAQAARSTSGTVTATDLIPRLGLAVDFGAVRAGHPVERRTEVRRPAVLGAVVSDLTEVARDGGAVVLVAQPGLGKSWLCEELTEPLQRDQWIVARHHCWLGSADTNRDQRVLSHVVIGSLLQQLGDEVPDSVSTVRPRYAATTETLSLALVTIRQDHPNRPIALIVDGLDHVTRVLGCHDGGAFNTALDPARALVDELAIVEFPPGVVLLLASQPGTHLDPVANKSNVRRIGLPAFDRSDLTVLADRAGVLAALGPTSSEPEAKQLTATLVELLHERSCGNALYATYLCRQALGPDPLLTGRGERDAPLTVDPIARLRDVPSSANDLDDYYAYLFAGLTDQQHVAVALLAVCDFAVTADELREIFPQIAPTLSTALRAVAPIVTQYPSIGGLKIHHESFSRYIRGHQDDDAWMDAVRDAAARWLAGRGFYTDARAFRHLPSLLAELGRHDEIAALVGPDFLSLAIAGLQPSTAVAHTLAVVASSAARHQDWPTLVRSIELRRAAETYARDRVPGCLVEYADVLVELLGGKNMGDSLLHDGEATVPAQWGLQLCAAVDAAGGAAPWKTYLHAADNTTDYGHRNSERVFLAKLRGDLRQLDPLDGKQKKNDERDAAEIDISGVQGEHRGAQDDHQSTANVGQRLADFLDQDDLPALSRVLDVVWDVLGPDSILAAVPHLKDSRRRGEVLLYLAGQIADHGTITDDLPSPQTLALAAWKQAGSSLDGRSLLAAGVPAEDLANKFLREDGPRALHDATEEVLRHPHADRAGAVRRWLSAIAITGAVDPAAVTAVLGQLDGVGFYRAWLHFAVSTTGLDRQIAVGRLTAGQGSSVVRVALEQLAEHAQPFTGTPRACDLYDIHQHIQQVLQDSVALLDTDDLPAALTALQAISDGTTTSLNGSGGYGPLTTIDLLALLSRTVGKTDADIVHTLVQRLRDDVVERGGFYTELGNFELEMARVSLLAGDSSEARDCWRRAAHYMAGYGDHKDTTIHELLDPLRQLAVADLDQAKIRLSRVQPLTELVVRHTDGKETWVAPHDWWRQLADIDPACCADHAAEMLLTNAGLPDARISAAHLQLLTTQAETADPVVLAALRVVAGAQRRHLAHDVALFERLAASAHTEAARCSAVLPLLADAITATYDDQPGMDTDPDHVGPVPTEQLREAAQRLGGVGPPPRTMPPAPTNASLRTQGTVPNIATALHASQRPSLPPSGIGAIYAIRDYNGKPDDADPSAPRWDTGALINVIGWRVLQVAHDSGPDAAARLLRRIADEFRTLDETTVLADLGAGLALRDEPTLAAITYTLAYTRTRGGRGWLTTFTEREHLDLWRRARTLDGVAATACLADEVAGIVHDRVTQTLIGAFTDPTAINQPGTADAFACWDAAFGVIASRLPGAAFHALTYRPSSTATGQADIDLALTRLALSTLALPERGDRRRALVAATMLLAVRPTLTQRAVTRVLAADLGAGPLTWLMEVLHMGLHKVPLADELVHQLTALTTSPALSVRAAATRLLTMSGNSVPHPPPTPAHPALVAAWPPSSGGLITP